jgi:hypothetical protein
MTFLANVQGHRTLNDADSRSIAVSLGTPSPSLAREKNAEQRLGTPKAHANIPSFCDTHFYHRLAAYNSVLSSRCCSRMTCFLMISSSTVN